MTMATIRSQVASDDAMNLLSSRTGSESQRGPKSSSPKGGLGRMRYNAQLSERGKTRTREIAQLEDAQSEPICARTVWDVVEVCVPISWLHMITIHPGERLLTELVRQQQQRLLAGVSETEHDWRDMVEASLDRWWTRAHADYPREHVRFLLAREHALRGLPRVRRGVGAGELLLTPQRSETPIEARGVTQEWINAFFVWMHEARLFRLPTRVFVECFVTLVTAPHGCALYDFIPPAFRCAPQTFTCHAYDDELYALLAANQQAPWLSFLAVQQVSSTDPLLRRATATPAAADLPTHVSACVAACAEGVVVYLTGKGEPAEAIRPLLRAWCLVEICSAPREPDETDPYAAPRSPPALRFAIGGVDDDMERHRAIAEAIRTLSAEAATAEDEADGAELQRRLRGVHGGYAAVNARLREAARRAFFAYYQRPQHTLIQRLYAPQTLW